MKNVAFVLAFIVTFISYVNSAPKYLNAIRNEISIAKKSRTESQNIINKALKQNNFHDFPDYIVLLWNSKEYSKISSGISDSKHVLDAGSRRRSKRHPEWGWFAATRRLRNKILVKNTNRNLRKEIGQTPGTQPTST